MLNLVIHSDNEGGSDDMKTRWAHHTNKMLTGPLYMPDVLRRQDNHMSMSINLNFLSNFSSMRFESFTSYSRRSLSIFITVTSG